MICPLAAMILAGSCSSDRSAEKIRFTGEAQGTYYAITYFDHAKRNLQPSVDSLLKAFDQTASLWVDTSMICRVNNNEDVVINDDFLEIFRISQEVSEKTGGAFDVTVGPLVRAWGFGPDKEPQINAGTVDSLLPIIGYRNLLIRNNRVIKSDPRVKLDFNAVAQGYSVDLLARFLESKGIEDYLIDIGGEVYAHGMKPDDEGWVVGIEKPSEDQASSRELSAEIPVTNRAVATSGNYRKYYEKDGVRYSHTIDPHTGYPVKHSLLGVTVVADNCAYADAYATAFMVMGLDSALMFLNRTQTGMEAFFVFSGPDGEYEMMGTEGLKGTLKKVE